MSTRILSGHYTKGGEEIQVRFLCGDCGKPVRAWDRRSYHFPETRDSIPLREIMHNQLERAGRQMCPACSREYIRREGITDPGEIERIMP